MRQVQRDVSPRPFLQIPSKIFCLQEGASEVLDLSTAGTLQFCHMHLCLSVETKQLNHVPGSRLKTYIYI